MRLFDRSFFVYCHQWLILLTSLLFPATKMDIKKLCHINKPLIPLKIMMMLVHGGLAANLAFMALHMKSLGISVPETALILTVFPLVAAIGPPAGGALADKLGNYKIVFCLATLLSVALHLMLYFLVPAIPGSTVGAVAVVNITTESPLTLEAWCSLSHGSSAFVYPVGIYNQCPAVNASQPTITFVDVQTQNSTIIQSCWQSPRSVIQADLCQTDTFSSLPSGLRLDQVYEVVKKECAYLHRRHSTVADVKCWYSCAVSAGSNWTCPKNETTPEKADRVTTLASYIALRLTATIAMWLAVPLLDSIAVMMVRQHDSDLGKQRMWSQVGFAATPPVVGALIAYESKRNGFEDYGPSFYVFSAMHLIAAFLVFILKTDKKLPAQSLAKSIGVLFHDRRVISLIMAVFIAGCGFGFLTAFLLWFMEEELHSAKFMLGLTQTIAGLSGILGMFCAGWIIRRIGYTAIFAFGILLYSPRFLALSFVPAGQDYYVQLLQILDGISHGLVMVAAAEYAGKLSPKYVASLQGIIFAAHYCFGKGGGSLMGGLLYNKFGPRMSFRIYSMIYASLFVVYAVSHYFIVARPHQRRKSELKARNSDASAEQALLEAQNSEKSDGPPTNLPSIYRDLDQKPINGFGHSSPHEDEAIHSLGYEKNAEFR